MNTKTFYQAVLSGVIAILLGLLLSLIFASLKPQLGAECETWDQYYVFEVVLFFTGVVLRLLLEVDGAKKYLLSH
jgi:hypothetical protein